MCNNGYMTIIYTILMHVVIYSIMCPPIHSWLLSIVGIISKAPNNLSLSAFCCFFPCNQLKVFQNYDQRSNQPRVEHRLDDLPKRPLRGLFLSQFRCIVRLGKAKPELVYQCKILVGLQAVQLKQYIVVGVLEFQSCIQMFLIGQCTRMFLIMNLTGNKNKELSKILKRPDIRHIYRQYFGKSFRSHKPSLTSGVLQYTPSMPKVKRSTSADTLQTSQRTKSLTANGRGFPCLSSGKGPH